MMGRRTSQQLTCLLVFSSLLAGSQHLAHPVLMPQETKEGARDGATESKHLKGPSGLQGWTLNYPFPDSPQDRYPRILVITRDGRVIRRITGKHYIWKWIFWNDGRQVAYEDGPPHFLMRCILVDLKTGSEIENHDCFSELPKNSPLWLQSLERVR